MVTSRWHELPPIEQSAPVMALAADSDAVWAAGLGGVARLTNGVWQSQSAALPLTSVAALVYVDGWLLAGGAGGIARSHDGGKNWQKVELRAESGGVTAIAPSPNFSHDGTALAATLNAGILRTTDGGREWQPATFGLGSLEVVALVWLDTQVVLAGTADGLYRSANAGRAWEYCIGTQGAPIAALSVSSDGSLYAAVELGGILRSSDGGLTWARHGDLPPDIAITALLAAENGLFVGSVEHGLLSSADDGISCQVNADAVALAFGLDGCGAILAGTESGILRSTDGKSWSELPPPPLHDLRRLLIVDAAPLVYGVHSTPVLYREGWLELNDLPLPLTALTGSPNGVLLASSQDGLVRSSDSGQSWQSALTGVAGCVGWLTLQANGVGYAASEDGTRLLRTRDDGLTWEPLPAPFGVLPLVALQGIEAGFAKPGRVLAATYDPRQHSARLWHSADDGEHWQPGAELQTDWPFVSMLDQPILLTLGGYVFWEKSAGGWQAERVGDGGGIRRIVSSAGVLFALSASGLYCSDDGGLTWARADDGLPLQQIIDIAFHETVLYVLLAGGQVCYQLLDEGKN